MEGGIRQRVCFVPRNKNIFKTIQKSKQRENEETNLDKVPISTIYPYVCIKAVFVFFTCPIVCVYIKMSIL